MRVTLSSRLFISVAKGSSFADFRRVNVKKIRYEV